MNSLIDKLFRQRTDNIYLQFFRYIFVGGTAFVVDFFFLYFFSDICGIYYLISAILSFVISVIVNYLMSIKWVFNQDNIDKQDYGVQHVFAHKHNRADFH